MIKTLKHRKLDSWLFRPPKTNFIEIYKIIKDEYNVSNQQIKSSSREKDIKDARHMWCYLAFHMVDYKKSKSKRMTNIGIEIGSRHRTTVVNSLKVIQNYIDINMDDFVDNLLIIFSSIRTGKYIPAPGADQQYMDGVVVARYLIAIQK